MLLTKKALDEIAQYLDMDFRCFVHKETSEFISLPNEDEHYGMDTEAWQEDIDKVFDNRDKYFEFEKMDSTSSFRVMAAFVDSLPNNSVKVRLMQALEGAKPFKNFKHQIDNSGDYRQDWFDFQREKGIEWVQDQLNRDFE